MSRNFENKYARLKNYELETVFELSKKEKQKLSSKIDPKTKHNLKLQEMYLKLKTYNFQQIEEEVIEYINHHGYLLEEKQISAFYELLAYAAEPESSDKERKYLNLTVENYPTLYAVKRSIYFALSSDNIYMAARLMLIAIEADLEFDEQLSYYNLVVEHYFEDDPIEYYKLMVSFQDKYISVDNITLEFNFNKLLAKYYIQKRILKDNEKECLETKKDVNEQLLKAISSMKDEDDLRSEVLRVREVLPKIDDIDNEYDFFDVIAFNLLPKPKGTPSSSPLNKLY